MSIAISLARAAGPCEKGMDAEVCVVAGTLLAMRKISVLLLQKCGVLSSTEILCRIER